MNNLNIFLRFLDINKKLKYLIEVILSDFLNLVLNYWKLCLMSGIIIKISKKCWKSRVRESDGKERVKRGCTSDPDQVPFICNKLAPGSRHGALYHVECCYGDYCNDGPFPILERLGN